MKFASNPNRPLPLQLNKLTAMEMKIQPVTHTDIAAVTELLKANKLPTADINLEKMQLFMATGNGKVIGTVGVEQYGNVGLLRSLAVSDEHKSRKIGERLLKHLLEYCKEQQIQELYLLTTTAERYFLKHGFEKIDRMAVHPAIMQTQEFKDICPASAVAMVKR